MLPISTLLSHPRDNNILISPKMMKKGRAGRSFPLATATLRVRRYNRERAGREGRAERRVNNHTQYARFVHSARTRLRARIAALTTSQQGALLAARGQATARGAAGPEAQKGNGGGAGCWRGTGGKGLGKTLPMDDTRGIPLQLETKE